MNFIHKVFVKTNFGHICDFYKILISPNFDLSYNGCGNQVTGIKIGYSLRKMLIISHCVPTD